MGETHSKKVLVEQWIEKANHDLGISETLVLHKSPFTDGICFHAQQAVEKYLKAVLVFFEIPFKKSHNLSYLADLLSEKVDITKIIYEKLEFLEEFAVEIRYPDAGYDPTSEEAIQALGIADFFRKLALGWISNDNFNELKGYEKQ